MKTYSTENDRPSVTEESIGSFLFPERTITSGNTFLSPFVLEILFVSSHVNDDNTMVFPYVMLNLLEAFCATAQCSRLRGADGRKSWHLRSLDLIPTDFYF